MANSPSQSFNDSPERDSTHTNGERRLTVHELEAVKRQSSLILEYLSLKKTDPEAIAGEPFPTFKEPMTQDQIAAELAAHALRDQSEFGLAG